MHNRIFFKYLLVPYSLLPTPYSLLPKFFRSGYLKRHDITPPRRGKTEDRVRSQPTPNPDRGEPTPNPDQEGKKEEETGVGGESFLLAVLSGHDIIPQISNPDILNILDISNNKKSNQLS
ncbi:MAG: hypothetical protein SWX82_31430 [Cyanobacteriota bacterium]|nr:hypothetical protein [Cyanobacteriota bacterium]